jgi:transposase
MLIHETFADRYVDDFYYATFLREQVLARLRGPIVLLQDRGAMHRGECTRDLLEDFFPRLEVHEFPAYAPDLNPVEQLWNWTKDKELVNYYPTDLTELVLAVEHVMKATAADQPRLQTFFAGCKLTW